MLRYFSICDTDRAFLDRLAEVLHQLYDPCKIEYLYGPSALEVFLYSSRSSTDVLITEIELRGQSAVDIISQTLKESRPTQVIYMTSKMEYCTDVYRTRHSGFLVKPFSRDQLAQTLERALETLEQEKKDNIVIPKSNSIYVIRGSTLIYAESRGRVFRVFTDREVLEAYGKFTDLCRRLDIRFLQCHKSYMVNMDRVSRFQGDSFLMDNGQVVPISQSRRKEARERFWSYMENVAALAPGPESAGF